MGKIDQGIQRRKAVPVFKLLVSPCGDTAFPGNMFLSQVKLFSALFDDFRKTFINLHIIPSFHWEWYVN